MKTVAALCILSASVASIKLGDEVDDAHEEYYYNSGWTNIRELQFPGGSRVPDAEIPNGFDRGDDYYRNFESIYSESCDNAVYEPEGGEIARV